MVRKSGVVPASPALPAPRVPRERGPSVLERQRAEEMVVEQREESRRVVRKLTLVPVGSRNVDGGALVTADGETTSMVPSVEQKHQNSVHVSDTPGSAKFKFCLRVTRWARGRSVGRRTPR